MRRMLVLVLATVLSISAVIVVPNPSSAVVPGAIGRIAFMSGWEIYVRDFSGASPIQLTNNLFHDDDPAWSPDGSKIAFASYRKSIYDVWVMDTDGTGQVNLSNNPFYDGEPAWSPDGSKIAFTSKRNGNDEVYVMNADGTSQTNLSNNVFYDGDPAWSPDGSKIAFITKRDGNYEVYVMNAVGTGRVNLSNDPSYDGQPAWSPDGSKIAFSSTRDGNYEIYVMDADGENQTRITIDPAWDGNPAWSPDGSKIAFTSDRDVGTVDFDIFMMNPDGTDVGHLTDNPSNEYSVDWEAVNRPPVAVNDTATVARAGSATITVLANDSDPDGNQVRLDAIVTAPTHGAITNKWVTSFVYTHDGSASTSDTFTYRISDGTLTDTATVSITITSTPPTTAPGPGGPRFVDVPAAHTFYADIEWLAAKGITKGCNPPTNDHYCPDANVTRGQMAAFLVRAMGYTDNSGGDLFIDDNDSIFESDIDRLGTAGVTKGCNPPSNTKYCPDAHVTRAQMAAFLVRAMGYTDDGGGNLFTDDDSSIFEADIDRLGTAGVTKGCNPPTNTKYCPDAHVTRAQMAAFLHRALG